jgi:hypothetical protein
MSDKPCFYGKTIHEVIVQSINCSESTFKATTTKGGVCKFPPAGYLPNFDVVGEKQAKRGGKPTRLAPWLILGNEGNTILTERITHYVFGDTTDPHDIYLAVNRKTGDVKVAWFGTDKRKNWVILEDLGSVRGGFKLPEGYIPKLDELISRKRPWCLDLPTWLWAALYDGSRGLTDCVGELIVEFQFDDCNLRLWQDGDCAEGNYEVARDARHRESR